MAVCGGNQIIAGGGHRFLRLHDFDCVGYAGDETVPRLFQCLTGQHYVALCDGYLVGCRLDVEEGGPHLIFNLSSQIRELIATLLFGRLGLLNIGANRPPSKILKLSGPLPEKLRAIC